jgi:hypothetical protein
VQGLFIEEKCQDFETLIIYSSILQAQFVPYLAQNIELTFLLLNFNFYNGVRKTYAVWFVFVLQPCGIANVCDQACANVAILQEIKDYPDNLNGLYKLLSAHQLHWV